MLFGWAFESRVSRLAAQVPTMVCRALLITSLLDPMTIQAADSRALVWVAQNVGILQLRVP